MKQECITQNKKGLYFEKLEYDDNSQNVYLLEGMPIIARKNSKELDIFNNETFIIKEIQYDKKNIVIIDDDDVRNNIPFDKFQNLFYVAYAITIYKSQGSTFDSPYTIHEFNHPLFDDRLKYVSLSRSVDKDYINIII
jgi:ATP-dependent exoDNAse (exonuclease V) alpha subunit